MCTNKYSIDALIGVYVSSIVNEVIRTISNLFIFLTKRFRMHKNTSQTKTNYQNKIRQTKNSKGWKRVEIVCFAFSCFFSTQTFFVKKIKRFEIAMTTSFKILLVCIYKHVYYICIYTQCIYLCLY